MRGTWHRGEGGLGARRENGIHQRLSRHCALIAGLSVVETEGNTRLFSPPSPLLFFPRLSLLPARCSSLFCDAEVAMEMPAV
jgi:hypothetical protein